MTLPAPTYDLVLLLDRSETGEEADAARAKIVADAKAAIEAQGELLRHDDWGNRTLTYPIDRKTEAEYHLFQFHSPNAELLSSLNRTLRIVDGVLRFRLIKLKPGVPDAPEMHASAVSRTADPAAGIAETASEPDAAPASEMHTEPAAETAEPAAETSVPAAETGIEVEAGESA
jgi:small subunit ribosomal protein S6